MASACSALRRSVKPVAVVRIAPHRPILAEDDVEDLRVGLRKPGPATVDVRPTLVAVVETRAELIAEQLLDLGLRVHALLDLPARRRREVPANRRVPWHA